MGTTPPYNLTCRIYTKRKILTHKIDLSPWGTNSSHIIPWYVHSSEFTYIYSLHLDNLRASELCISNRPGHVFGACTWSPQITCNTLISVWVLIRKNMVHFIPVLKTWCSEEMMHNQSVLSTFHTRITAWDQHCHSLFIQTKHHFHKVFFQWAVCIWWQK